jgi:hypothetical protein
MRLKIGCKGTAEQMNHKKREKKSLIYYNYLYVLGSKKVNKCLQFNTYYSNILYNVLLL